MSRLTTKINASLTGTAHHIPAACSLWATRTETPGQIRKTVIYSVQEAAVCGSGFADLAEKAITMAQLTQYPMISLSEQSGTFRFYSQLFKNTGLYFSQTLKLLLPIRFYPW